MSLNLNHVTIAGNLTRDPEVRFLSNEQAVCNFGLAVNRRWKDKAGESKEEVTFIDCEAWGRTAELVAQYLKKGSPAYIEGRLKLDQWEDKDGKKQQKLRVVAESVQFLGSKGDQPAAERPAPNRPTPASSVDTDEPAF